MHITIDPLVIREYKEKNFIINPVKGGRPPRERVVRIIRGILIGESCAIALRCPKVKIFSKSKIKNIVVFIIR